MRWLRWLARWLRRRAGGRVRRRGAALSRPRALAAALPRRPVLGRAACTRPILLLIGRPAAMLPPSAAAPARSLVGGAAVAASSGVEGARAVTSTEVAPSTSRSVAIIPASVAGPLPVPAHLSIPRLAVVAAAGTRAAVGGAAILLPPVGAARVGVHVHSLVIEKKIPPIHTGTDGKPRKEKI